METKILQRLKKEEKDSFQLAEKYYSLLSAINDLKLTQREIPTINNIISKLKKIGVLVKDGTKVKVNPVIILNFDKDIVLEIKLVHGQA
jgi:hypothetical protein